MTMMMMMMMMLWWLHSNLQGRDWLIAKWATQLKEFAVIVMIKMVKRAMIIIIIIIIITIDNRVDHRIKALFNFFKRRSPIEDLAHIQESFLISISFEQELSRTNVWGKFDISSFWHTFNNSPFQSQLNRNCHADHQWISLLTYRKGLWSCPWTKGLTWFCLESWEPLSEKNCLVCQQPHRRAPNQVKESCYIFFSKHILYRERDTYL